MKARAGFAGKKSGFTLVELMIVIAVIAILAATGVPAVLNWLPNYRMKNSIRVIHSTFQTARIQAIKRNANIGILFNTVNDSYVVYLDTNLDGDNLDAGEVTLKSGQMPNDVNIDNALTAFTVFNNKTYFNSRGMTDTGGGSVVLRNDRNRYMRVLLWNSGNPEIQSSPDQGVTWN